MPATAPPPPRPDDRGPPSSVLAARLAVRLDGPIPTLDELGLGPAKTAAFAWQEQRSFALHREAQTLAATFTTGSTAADWIPEIHRILGVVGEQVLVAVEAEIEKEILVRHLSTLPEGGSRAASGRALRFFAEGQGNALVIAGHSVANLTARTIVLDPAYAPPAPALSVNGVAFTTPRSEAREVWLSLDQRTAQGLLSAASPPRLQEMHALAEETADLQSDPLWADLVRLRNVEYHRWRGESPGVTGIDLRADTAHERVGRGDPIVVGSQLLPDYTEGQQALDELVKISRAALDALVARMPTIMDAWVAAFRAAI